MSARPSDYFAARPDRVAALVAECRSWEGTPFRKCSAARGPQGGVDCAGFLPAVLLAIGAIDAPVAIPPYELNHGEHAEISLFHEWFRRPAVRARVRAVDESEPHVDGDFVFPKVARTEHHIGFRVGGDVFHVVRPAGVCRQSLAGLALAGVTLHRSRYRLTEGPR
jgi:hypothetical protein